MELDGVAESLKDKCIFITGSTGFLAKIFVEKVLRIQPDVKKVFLLVRAADTNSANRRLQDEVISKQLFDVLREKHREEFNSFFTEKVSPIAGDITIENLGIRDTDLRETLWNKIDIVMNVAATTNFYERYDVALNINVLGAKHVLEFAKKCPKLEMLLHVSTAYVAGVREGIILEKAFHMGETLKGGFDLDIEKELKLVEDKKRELYTDNNAEKDVQRSAMKELGLQRAKTFGWPNTYVFTKAMGEMLLGHLRGDLPLVILRPTIITSIYKEPLPGWIEGTRTIDSLIIGYVKGKLPCFFGDQELIMDVIPGDMVVNCMLFAITYHLNQRSQFIYHICSSTSNPVKYTTLERCGFKYFTENPRIGKNGEPIKTRRIPVFKKMYLFRAYMALRYWLPLEALHLVNVVLFQLFSEQYSMLSRKYKFVMRLVDLYEPYAYFRGCFDDINTEYLRMAMAKENSKDSKIFDFDTKNINWEDYLYDVHIPGVLKYVCK
ncbi:uncharacterized protein A4U43_C10F17210 [Asparagus officinalis]|uniref:Fatty acyl-CoA reductase n=1 Tax=Asparagus officinalis TaxID=4686 RepID=A0A5P1E3W1_ASPOF|nr:probable fatty acyl-CoA reductase 4 [Asparagus officinalis]ONK57159.1 uncharacterized protein A4U43_C10F17210 [Asparagus officinalis]